MRRFLMLLLASLLMVLPTLSDSAQPQQTPTPDGGSVTADAAESPAQATAAPAKAYVLVRTRTEYGWLPLPETGEYSYPLKQTTEDGKELENTIHLTENGVYMEHSNCDNQDCVEQGMVTIENRSRRILANMIICLPNQVSLELYTPEEILEMANQRQGQAQ